MKRLAGAAAAACSAIAAASTAAGVGIAVARSSRHARLSLKSIAVVLLILLFALPRVQAALVSRWTYTGTEGPCDTVCAAVGGVCDVARLNAVDSEADF